MEIFEKLKSFNLIKYTGHYVITIDEGGGRPIIFQGDKLEEILREVRRYTERTKKSWITTGS